MLSQLNVSGPMFDSNKICSISPIRNNYVDSLCVTSENKCDQSKSSLNIDHGRNWCDGEILNGNFLKQLGIEKHASHENFNDFCATVPCFTHRTFKNVINFTLNIRNVDLNKVQKTILAGNGYYGFHLNFISQCVNYVFEVIFPASCPTYDLDNKIDIECWDNNIVVQVMLPSPISAEVFLVGAVSKHMVVHTLNRETADDVHHDGDDEREPSSTEGGFFNYRIIRPISSKCRRVSEESSCSDSSFANSESRNCCSPLSSKMNLSDEKTPDDFSLPPSDHHFYLRGILKRNHEYDDSQTCELSSMDLEGLLADCSLGNESGKKSVRFSEVVRRQRYRIHSSILGQKHKNVKKCLQKKKRMAMASSSISPINVFPDVVDDKSDTAYKNVTSDSGIASSVEDVKVYPKSTAKCNRKKRKSLKTSDSKVDDVNDEYIFHIEI